MCYDMLNRRLRCVSPSARSKFIVALHVCAYAIPACVGIMALTFVSYALGVKLSVIGDWSCSVSVSEYVCKAATALVGLIAIFTVIRVACISTLTARCVLTRMHECMCSSARDPEDIANGGVENNEELSSVDVKSK